MPTPQFQPYAKVIHVCSNCDEEIEHYDMYDMTCPTCHSVWGDLYDGCDAYGWLNEDDEIIAY